MAVRVSNTRISRGRKSMRPTPLTGPSSNVELEGLATSLLGLSVGEATNQAGTRQHFTQMSPVPTVADLTETTRCKPQKNRTEGAYADAGEYLDVQFRLLREDLVKGLVDGVEKQRAAENLPTATHTRNSDVKAVYRNLRIVYPTFGTNGINFFVRLDMEQPLSQKICAGLQSKNLISGSLLCFSLDGFESNYLFATVAESDYKMFRNDRGFTVSFLPESLEVYRQMTNKAGPFLAVESQAYLESYSHVLRQLQSLHSKKLPMEKYIVRCNRDIDKPKYMEGSSLASYELLSAEKGKTESLLSAVRAGVCDGTQSYVSLQRFSNKLGLNPSQYRAYVTALTRELSLIQGPPGTGKTHVGLKIIQTILHNVYERTSNHFTSGWTGIPILVVCFTNHALDQFLEGILKFCDAGDILRIGGGSKNEKMKGCLMYNHRKKTPKRLSSQYGRLMGEKEEFEKKHNIGQLQKTMKELSRRIVDPFATEYEGFITESRFLEKFRRWRNEVGLDPEVNVLELWLECDPESFLSKHASSQHQENDFEERQEAESIDVKTDAEIEAERRLIVEDEEEMQAGRAKDKTAKAPAEDDDGGRFETVLSKKQRGRLRSHIVTGLTSSDVMTSVEVTETSRHSLRKMPLDQRWRLYRYWMNNYKHGKEEGVWSAIHGYQCLVDAISSLKVEMNISCMQQCKVVGMTTTGAAKYQASIQVVGPRVVIVEEAAEVLEAHIVTALSQDCQQLILIGDHKQLRPNPTVFMLAKDYKLDVSMFERLVNNKLPHTTLEQQHRMRPEISKFMSNIYTRLDDHSSVRGREPIRGITSSVYFFNHDVFEVNDPNGTSRANIFEADMIVGLTRYLIQQDYVPTDITIITMYTRQMSVLRNKMPKSEFEGVLVTSVDNYQGEENKILILSLVRSNERGEVGFVKIENRVCVSLSRAREGMFVFGNFDQFSQQSRLWMKVVEQAKAANEHGKVLNLSCAHHGRPALIQEPGDFELYAPDGGCTEPCTFTLDCAHKCRLKCHYSHDKYQCLEDCRNLLPNCHHPCPLRCYEKCEPCKKPTWVTLICGHMRKVPCHQSYGDIGEIECCTPCPVKLPCGHDCANRCSTPCTTKCLARVRKPCRDCGRDNDIPCHLAALRFTSADQPVCKRRCDKPLPCGHICSAFCSDCSRTGMHRRCGNTCAKMLPCGHICEQTCGHMRKCGECKQPCRRIQCNAGCENAPCRSLCGRPCSFTKMCSKPCPRPMQRCGECQTKSISCPGLCGEPCLTSCKACLMRSFTTSGIYLKQTPNRWILLNDCHHVVPVRLMDERMSTGDRCCPYPSCKKPVRSTERYKEDILVTEE